MARRLRPARKSIPGATAAFAVVFSSTIGGGFYAIVGGLLFHDSLLAGIGAALVVVAILAVVLNRT